MFELSLVPGKISLPLPWLKVGVAAAKRNNQQHESRRKFSAFLSLLYIIKVKLMSLTTTHTRRGHVGREPQTPSSPQKSLHTQPTGIYFDIRTGEMPNTFVT
jgi:hypothetical protein